MDGEFLDDRVGQQLRGKFGYPRGSGIVSRFPLAVAKLDLEPLALADGTHLAEAKPVAGTRDGLPLRVPDLRLQHDVDNNLGHVGSVRESTP